MKTNCKSNKLDSITVDGAMIPLDHYSYTTENGFLVVTLNKEFLKGLSEGQHEIFINLLDGYAVTVFNIKPTSFVIPNTAERGEGIIVPHDWKRE